MNLVVSTPPASEPLTVADAAAHLREDLSVLSSADQALLASFITAVRQRCETETNRAFITTGFTLTLDAFPACSDVIELPRPNLLAVSNVQYVDTAGVTQTLSTADYSVDVGALPGRIVLGYGKYWPSTRCQRNAVTIAFTAGYGPDASDVPDTIKAAMYLYLGDLWENREASIVGTIRTENPTADRVLDGERYVVMA